jgi:carboxylesterase type B
MNFLLAHIPFPKVPPTQVLPYLYKIETEILGVFRHHPHTQKLTGNLPTYTHTHIMSQQLQTAINEDIEETNTTTELFRTFVEKWDEIKEMEPQALTAIREMDTVFNNLIKNHDVRIRTIAYDFDKMIVDYGIKVASFVIEHHQFLELKKEYEQRQEQLRLDRQRNNTNDLDEFFQGDMRMLDI